MEGFCEYGDKPSGSNAATLLQLMETLCFLRGKNWNFKQCLDCVRAFDAYTSAVYHPLPGPYLTSSRAVRFMLHISLSARS